MPPIAARETDAEWAGQAKQDDPCLHPSITCRILPRGSAPTRRGARFFPPNSKHHLASRHTPCNAGVPPANFSFFVAAEIGQRDPCPAKNRTQSSAPGTATLRRWFPHASDFQAEGVAGSNSTLSGSGSTTAGNSIRKSAPTSSRFWQAIWPPCSWIIP